MAVTGDGGGGGDGGGDGGGGGGGSCTTATLPDLRAPGHEVQAAPLAVGRYLVAVTGEGSHNARKLVVTADAKDTSCALSQPGMQPMPLDPSAYSTSCSVDADCASATVGDVCQPCAYPNAAIAKSALQAYEGDYRAHDSHCHGTPGISFRVCAPSKAACTIMPNALTGTCELKPGL